jgi:hypothetical protein
MCQIDRRFCFDNDQERLLFLGCSNGVSGVACLQVYTKIEINLNFTINLNIILLNDYLQKLWVD